MELLHYTHHMFGIHEFHIYFPEWAVYLNYSNVIFSYNYFVM